MTPVAPTLDWNLPLQTKRGLKARLVSFINDKRLVIVRQHSGRESPFTYNEDGVPDLIRNMPLQAQVTLSLVNPPPIRQQFPEIFRLLSIIQPHYGIWVNAIEEAVTTAEKEMILSLHGSWVKSDHKWSKAVVQLSKHTPIWGAIKNEQFKDQLG